MRASLCLRSFSGERYGRPLSSEAAGRMHPHLVGVGCGRTEYRLQLAVDGLRRGLDRAHQGQDVAGVPLDPGDQPEEDVDPAVRAGEAAPETAGVVVTPNAVHQGQDVSDAVVCAVD